MNAEKLVKKILSHGKGGVEVLLNLAGNNETDWLELKASYLPENGKITSPEKHNKDDYIWSVTKGIVALANSHGGILIVGIDDQLNLVDIQGLGYREDKDAFIRKVMAKVLPAHLKCKHKRYEISENRLLQQTLTPKIYPYKKGNVLTILIPPLKEIVSVLEYSNKENIERSNAKERVFIRGNGDQGSTAMLYTNDAVNKYRDSRSVRNDFDDLYTKFEDNIKTYGRYLIPSADLKIKVSNYKDNFKNHNKKLYTHYTSLEGEKEERNFFEECAMPEIERIEKSKDKGVVKIDLFTAVENNNWTIILGEPGSGKTTVFRNYIYSAIDEKKEMFNIYIPLVSYDGNLNLEDYILKLTKLTQNDFIFLIHEKIIRLFLDGVNEVTEKKQEQVLYAIKNLVDKYSAIKIIISSRKQKLTVSRNKHEIIITIYLPIYITHHVRWSDKRSTGYVI